MLFSPSPASSPCLHSPYHGHRSFTDLHTILDHLSNEIHLLHLHHTQVSFLNEDYDKGLNIDSTSSIHCSLSTVSLDDHPHYDALSYVSGDASEVSHISLDSMTIPSPPTFTKRFAQVQHTTCTYLSMHCASIRETSLTALDRSS